MARGRSTVRSRDRSTSRRRRKVDCYCQDADDDDDDDDGCHAAHCGRKVSQRSTTGSFSSGQKCTRRKADSFLSDETFQHVPMRLQVPFSPPSPTLTAETQSVIDSVEKMLREARQEIMEFGREPSALNTVPIDYPFGPVVDNENDQQLYIRELVTSRLNELDTGAYKFPLQSRPRKISRALPKVDLSAPKFQRRNYQQFPHPCNHCHAERSIPYEIPAAKPIRPESNSRILEKIRGFSVQTCPKVNIDPELIAQKMEDVHISPDPSFVGVANVGNYEYHHDSCDERSDKMKRLVSSEGQKRRTKVCRIGGEGSTNAVGVQVDCSAMLRDSNGRASVEGEKATGEKATGEKVRRSAGTYQVMNGNQEGAASNLISGSIVNSIDEGGEERVGPQANAEEQREAPSKEGVNDGKGAEGGGGEGEEGKIERPLLLGEAAETRADEKNKCKLSSEVCTRCLSMPDNVCKPEENAQRKRNDVVQQILDDSAFVEESANMKSRLERMSQARKMGGQIDRDRRAKIDRDFLGILKRYDPRYKSDSSSSLEESLNIDSMSNSQILEYDLADMNLVKPRAKHFDAIISIYDQTIDKIARDSEEIKAKLSCWRESHSSGTDDNSSKLAGLQSSRKLMAEVATRDENTGDGRESVSKSSALQSHPEEAREYSINSYNLDNVPHTEVSRIIALNMTSTFVDYVPSREKIEERNRVEKESLVKRENCRGDGESLRATPNIPMNQRSMNSTRSHTDGELSVSVERSGLESWSEKNFPQTDRLGAETSASSKLSKTASERDRVEKGGSPSQSEVIDGLQFERGDTSGPNVVINGMGQADGRRVEKSSTCDALNAEYVNERPSPNPESRVVRKMSADSHAKSPTDRSEGSNTARRSIRARTASVSSLASKANSNVPGRTESTSNRSVSKNDRSAQSPSARKSGDSAATKSGGRLGDKSKNDGPSVPLSSKRIQLFSSEIARIKSSSQAPAPESKIFLTDTLSSADSLKDCPSFHTSVSYPRSQESAISDAKDKAKGESLIVNKTKATKATKSIQTEQENTRTDAKPVKTDVKCVGTERTGEEFGGNFIELNAQLAVAELLLPKRTDIDVEMSRQLLSVNREEEDNQSKSSRGSQNSSLDIDENKLINHRFLHSTRKIGETASDESRSEGEVYLATSSSYSLGEVRILGKDMFTQNSLGIEGEDSEGLIATKSTNSTSNSKSSTQSYGEVRG